MLRFAPNLSTLFQEEPFLKRFEAAKAFGFTHFEIQSPFEYDPSEIAKHVAGMKCVLINSYAGDDGYGFASVPGKEMEFCNSLNRVLEFQNILGFDKFHILSGATSADLCVDEQMDMFVKALDSATDFLEDLNLIGLIEPICAEVKPNYFLSSFDIATKIIESTANKNVKLLLDVYHLHKITGDVKGNLAKYYPYAGHIQVSQDPNRCEPFCEGGKIDYEYVFEFLKEKKHQDFIGLEYFPSVSTIKSLDWLKNYTSL